MAQEQSNVKDRQHSSLKVPRKYTVFIHNDDFTTMEFVVGVLTSVFHKTLEEAERLMLQVHHSEKAPVGSYSYDVAMTKVSKATEMARAEGFPLRLTIVAE
ncbi:MAG: ATP-dependent Clp protease adaptor ClpS [Muribaculaceae bacterium]|nr:ATP-dependent Clp protease adaptor ClpS [Muribaculaceae bacterium]